MFTRSCFRKTAPIRYIPYEQAYEHGFEDMRRRVPDLGKLRAATGFAPEVPLEQALTSIIAAYKATAPTPDPAVQPLQRGKTRVSPKQRAAATPALPLPNPG